jgi:threonine/homoserine/homoserine lactone efflux protein
MAADSVLGFWAVAVLLIVVPGADWAFTISAGSTGKSVLPAVGGLVLGYAAMTVIVAAGVGALVASTPAVLLILSITGGAYLVWRGATTLAKPAAAGLPTPCDIDATRAWLRRGVGVSGLNPKSLLLFLAVLPQFTDRHSGWPVPGQMGLLGLIFALSCGLFYLGLGSVARTVLSVRPNLARRVTRASGLAMVLIGISLPIEHFIV